MLHTLGLFHEHQRPDRDDYIFVNMSALAKTGNIQQFKKACFLSTALNPKVLKLASAFKHLRKLNSLFIL